MGLVDDFRCSGEHTKCLIAIIRHPIKICIVIMLIICLFLKTLSLELMTLEPVCRDVETAQGVPITVTGVAQVPLNILKLSLIKKEI